MSDLRADSRKNYTGNGTTDHLNAGSLQRIADATERIAANYSEILEARDKFKRWYEEERDRRRKIERSNAALRGAITRLKRGGR